jgi:membrane protease YdiL (CAAX protease family)
MIRALGSAAFVLLVVGAAVAYALRLPEPSEGSRLLPALALPYVMLGAIGFFRMRRDESWRAALRFRPGDPSIGILLGVFLVLAAWALGKVLFPPEAVQHAWVLRIFLTIGDTSTPLTLFWLILLAVAEELVWRGWVQTELSRAFGPRRGWALCAVLYAAAYLPTLFTLADAAAGYNPLIVLAALGCGLCWAFSRERTGRLFPSVFSHAAFSYRASQFLWRII